MADAGVLKIFDELKDLHKAKDADYAGGEPLSNFKRCEQLGVPAWKGTLIRLSDKYSRLVSLVAKDGQGEVAGEGIDDTLRDLAVYAVIALRLWQASLMKDPKEWPPPKDETEETPFDRYRPGVQAPSQEEDARWTGND